MTLLYPFLLTQLFIVFLFGLEKVCVVNFGFQNPQNFQLKVNPYQMEGYNNNNNNNNNQGFFGRPQGVWESEFPVGNSFLLRGTEKKTHPLKWSGN